MGIIFIDLLILLIFSLLLFFFIVSLISNFVHFHQ